MLRAGILGFWALWLTIVTASNITNGLRVAEVLPSNFPFASANFQLIEGATAIYGTPASVVWVLFVGVILWEGLAAGLFFRAARSFWASGEFDVAPFVAAMGLFACFMLADELLIAYPMQATHMRIFIALGVSLLILRVVPSQAD